MTEVAVGATASEEAAPAAAGPRRGISFWRYVVRVTVRTVGMLWLVATITFLVVRALPGNPVDIYMQDLQGQGLSAADARQRASTLLRIDVDRSLPMQYLTYVKNLARGDLGDSLVLSPGTPVAHLIAGRLPWTLFSVCIALLLGFLLGVRLGSIAAYRRGSVLDHLITNVSAVLDSVPAVLVGIMLVFYLGVVWQVVPLDALRGAYAADATPGLNVHFLSSAIGHALMPGLVYVLTSLGGWALAMRSNAVSVLNEEYVSQARARGLPERVLRSQYVKRNARLPLITGFAISLGFVVSGSVLIEDVFVYPGVGQLLATALARRDYTVMQGIVLVTTFTVLLATAAADALYGWLDPRVRIGGGAP